MLFHIRVPLKNLLSVSAHSKKTVFPDETEKPDDKSVCNSDMITRFIAETPFFDFLCFYFITEF
jgi:hypothetical protein